MIYNMLYVNIVVYQPRNSALILSDAEYVMFCDADDGFVSNIGVYSLVRSLI